MKIKFQNQISTPSHKSKMVIFIDSQVYKAFSSKLKPWLKHHNTLAVIKLTAGEKLKSMDSLSHTLTQCLNAHCKRDTLLVAIGGGSILDFTGFIASIWMRGISWMAIPTTVLAMVDSAFGGKTAINFGGRKNLIGSIYQPEHILVYFEFLKTLPDVLIIDGLSEVFKHAILSNDQKLLAQVDKIVQKKEKISLAVLKKSLLLKEKIIDSDFQEKKQKRIKLNLGHTFGHALEQQLPQLFNHGNGVWWGLLIELYFSMELKGKKLQPAFSIVQNYLKSRINFAIELYAILEHFYALLSQTEFDKKNTAATKQTWVLLHSPGQSYICHQIPVRAKEQLHKYLQSLRHG